MLWSAWCETEIIPVGPSYKSIITEAEEKFQKCRTLNLLGHNERAGRIFMICHREDTREWLTTLAALDEIYAIVTSQSR